MKQFRKIATFCSLVLMLAFTAIPASAHLLYSVSNYATGAAGLIIGDSEKPEIYISNLNGDAIAVALQMADGTSRILTCNRDSWVNNGGDRNQIYNPFYGGKNWNVKPESEFAAKYMTGKYKGTTDGNAHGFAVIGDYLYAYYWGNTYNFFGIDYTSKVVKYDMSKKYKKVDEYYFKPELEDPNLAAQMAGMIEYEGNLYVVCSGYITPEPVTEIPGSSSKPASGQDKPYLYDMNSYVIKLSPDLEELDRIVTKGKNIWSMGGNAANMLDGKILICSTGGGCYDFPQPRPDSCISIVDLKTMTSETPVTVKSLQDSGIDFRTNFSSATADKNGNIYILTYLYDIDEETQGFGSNHKIVVYKTTLDKLCNGDVGEIIMDGHWSGASTGIAYDPETDYLWVLAGRLSRYNVKTGEWKNFDGKALGGGAYNLSILPNPKNKVENILANITTAPDESVIQPEGSNFSAEKKPDTFEFNDENKASLSGKIDFEKSDFAKMKNGEIGIDRNVVESVASELRKSRYRLVDIFGLPIAQYIFDVGSEHNQTAFIYEVEGQDLCEKTPYKVRVATFKDKNTGELLRYAWDRSLYKNGFFNILNEDGTVVNVENAEEIEISKKYLLVIYVGDDDTCDADKTTGSVTIAPAILRYQDSSMPPRTTEDGSIIIPEDGGEIIHGKTDQTLDDGGCNVGIGGLILLFFVPLVLCKKNN